MTATIIRGDARRLPLPDASVDLIVTSPPYWALRSYTDGGEHYDGQIGAEPAPAAYIASLIDCTREWMRVLKPTGSIFVNLGDKYARPGGGVDKQVRSLAGAGRGTTGRQFASAKGWDGPPEKSLILLPERYRIACVDELGLIARAVIVWDKPNGLPESVTDRVRRSHEDWVHLVKSPRYFAAVNTIREAHVGGQTGLAATFARPKPSHTLVPGQSATQQRADRPDVPAANPLGKLPGSVWEIATQPLKVPDHISHHFCCNGRKQAGCTDGIDHFAAYPMEWPRRIVQGWSPSGICTACGEGRRPVLDRTPMVVRPSARRLAAQANGGAQRTATGGTMVSPPTAVITGEACACTPYTDHPGTGESSGPRDIEGHYSSVPFGGGNGSQLPTRPKTGPWREYHFDRWTPAPTRPAVVVDPFGGTGTTALLAHVLGRHGITVDMSRDYCWLAEWRTTDPGQLAAALEVPKPAAQHRDQGDLLTLFEVGA